MTQARTAPHEQLMSGHRMHGPGKSMSIISTLAAEEAISLSLSLYSDWLRPWTKLNWSDLSFY